MSNLFVGLYANLLLYCYYYSYSIWAFSYVSTFYDVFRYLEGNAFVGEILNLLADDSALYDV